MQLVFIDDVLPIVSKFISISPIFKRSNSEIINDPYTNEKSILFVIEDQSAFTYTNVS